MGNECIQCGSGYLLQNNECVSQCAEGKRSSSNGECVQCQLGCLSCGETKCYRCAEGFQLSGDSSECLPHSLSSNSPACPSTMFLDEQSGQCVGCGDTSCVRCHGAGECIECREGLILRRGQCVPSCGDGFFKSLNEKECFKCASLCSRCQSSEVCVECRSDGMLQGGRCLPHCSDGYFNDAGSCVNCASSCETCIGPKDNECVSCGSGRKMTKSGTCALTNQIYEESRVSLFSNGTCSEGFYYDDHGRECRACHPSCTRCIGALPFQCRTCRYPLRLDRGSSRCIPCCYKENAHDCCHCDEKRHSGNSPTIYNGECHFVSRRVSESVEREISSGGSLSDKVVLMSFWFTVFILVMAVIITFQRKKRKNRGGASNSGFNDDNPSFNYSSSGKSSSDALLSTRTPAWSKSMKYTPLKLSDEAAAAGENDNNSGEIDIDFQDDDEDDEQEQALINNMLSEGVPLVLKT